MTSFLSFMVVTVPRPTRGSAKSGADYVGQSAFPRDCRTGGRYASVVRCMASPGTTRSLTLLVAASAALKIWSSLREPLGPFHSSVHVGGCAASGGRSCTLPGVTCAPVLLTSGADSHSPARRVRMQWSIWCCRHKSKMHPRGLEPPARRRAFPERCKRAPTALRRSFTGSCWPWRLLSVTTFRADVVPPYVGSPNVQTRVAGLAKLPICASASVSGCSSARWRVGGAPSRPSSSSSCSSACPFSAARSQASEG